MSDRGLLEELVRLPEMARPTVSPDGEKVAFYHNGTGRNELYVLDVESGDEQNDVYALSRDGTTELVVETNG